MRYVLFAALFLALAACGAAAAPIPPQDPMIEGRRLFTIWCSGCHAVEAGAPAGIGPNLAGVATLAVENAEGLDASAWLRRELLDPNAQITPGYSAGLMPTSYGSSLNQAQVDALVAYMLTLK